MATYFECLLVQNGGEIIDPKTGKIVFDSPAGQGALRFMVDLVHKYHCANFYLGGYQHQIDFASGKVGMIVASCVSRTFMSKQLNFDWGLTPLMIGKRAGVLVYGTNIIIFSRSSTEKQKLAWEFIKWFTSPEISARWALLTNYVPVRKSTLKLKIMRDEFARNPDSRVPIDELKAGFFEPRFTQWLRVREYLGDAVKESLLGKTPPGRALRRAVERGNLWLK